MPERIPFMPQLWTEKWVKLTTHTCFSYSVCRNLKQQTVLSVAGIVVKLCFLQSTKLLAVLILIIAAQTQLTYVNSRRELNHFLAYTFIPKWKHDIIQYILQVWLQGLKLMPGRHRQMRWQAHNAHPCPQTGIQKRADQAKILQRNVNTKKWGRILHGHCKVWICTVSESNTANLIKNRIVQCWEYFYTISKHLEPYSRRVNSGCSLSLKYYLVESRGNCP